MKTTNHTPSPWLAHIDINQNDSGLNDIRILEPSTETENLTANTIAVLNQNMGREAIANAHLIAAAPKLLQVLKDLLPEFVDLYERFDPTGEIAVWDQWTQEALEVIAEAEGVA